jgi:hypothetical protein
MRIWVLLGLLACEGEEEAPIASTGEFVLPSCDKYEKEPGIQGFCRTVWAPTLGSLVEMEESCGKARAWESNCRAAWIATQMSTEWGMDQDHHRLLEICGEHQTCALEVLKTRTDPDIGAQLRLCHEHVSDHADECVEHSLKRWWRGNSDPDMLGTLKALDTSSTETVGWWIAALAICESKSPQAPCDGTREGVLEACSAAASQLKQDSDGCNRMQLDRADPTGVPQDKLPPIKEPTAPVIRPQPEPFVEPEPLILVPPIEDNPPQPEPGAGNVGDGVAAPDPRTHGHVPDGTLGGGHHPPPNR